MASRIVTVVALFLSSIAFWEEAVARSVRWPEPVMRKNRARIVKNNGGNTITDSAEIIFANARSGTSSIRTSRVNGKASEKYAAAWKKKAAEIVDDARNEAGLDPPELPRERSAKYDVDGEDFIEDAVEDFVDSIEDGRFDEFVDEDVKRENENVERDDVDDDAESGVQGNAADEDGEGDRDFKQQKYEEKKRKIERDTAKEINEMLKRLGLDGLGLEIDGNL